ncbi:MAG: ABC transporter permease [Acidobacteriia bacterium]|nr:ABC transporter permease [Terriglobia bacterium]
MSQTFELVVKPRKGWQPLDFHEIWLYRELLGFLVWRDVKVRYKQTVLGGLWALLQPLAAMLIFTLFFNRLAGIQSNGPPYPLFAYAGVTAWTFFSNAVSASSNSLIGNQQLISKVYFPRIFVPMGAIGALLLDMLISLVLMFALLLYYRWPASLLLLELPVFMLGSFLAASGFGLILSAMNVRFRDVKYAVPFAVQMGFFVTPVIYPLNYIPARYRLAMSLNPMTGMVEGFRHSLLGTAAQWNVMGLSLAVSVLIFVTGLYTFRRMERLFADII